MTESSMGIACRTGEGLSGAHKRFAGKSTAPVLIVIVKDIPVTGRGGP
jgi:hypothetical protein